MAVSGIEDPGLDKQLACGETLRSGKIREELLNVLNFFIIEVFLGYMHSALRAVEKQHTYA